VNGAALASSLAYLAHFSAALFVYARLSGSSPLRALVPGREDLRLYGDAWHGFLARVSRNEPERPSEA
jgi:hypothetical protein